MTDTGRSDTDRSDTLAIGVDWGTSAFRAYRLGPSGEVLEIRNAPAGILAIDDGAFEDALLQIVGDWMAAAPAAPVVLSGMIGSRNGWIETPYHPCPAALEDLVRTLNPIGLENGRVIYLACGLSTRDADGVPDVMRGEEVQILGALGEGNELGDGPALICLPGTHSKWATAEDGRVTGFATYMTGEMFDVLRRHSILGKTIEHAAWDDTAFLDGIDRSGSAGGLLHQAFGVRAATLLGGLTPDRAGAFLSGLVIGTELRAALSAAETDGPVLLIGEEGLTRLYGQALEHLGRAHRVADKHVAARGLWRLARALDAPGIASGDGA